MWSKGAAKFKREIHSFKPIYREPSIVSCKTCISPLLVYTLYSVQPMDITVTSNFLCLHSHLKTFTWSQDLFLSPFASMIHLRNYRFPWRSILSHSVDLSTKSVSPVSHVIDRPLCWDKHKCYLPVVALVEPKIIYVGESSQFWC